jgi:hypothetical protein
MYSGARHPTVDVEMRGEIVPAALESLGILPNENTTLPHESHSFESHPGGDDGSRKFLTELSRQALLSKSVVCPAKRWQRAKL